MWYRAKRGSGQQYPYRFRGIIPLKLRPGYLMEIITILKANGGKRADDL